jgi:hypothetical protein
VRRLAIDHKMAKGVDQQHPKLYCFLLTKRIIILKFACLGLFLYKFDIQSGADGACQRSTLQCFGKSGRCLHLPWAKPAKSGRTSEPIESGCSDSQAYKVQPESTSGKVLKLPNLERPAGVCFCPVLETSTGKPSKSGRSLLFAIA